MPFRGALSSSAADPTAAASYDWDYLCKFILIGDSSVGKSALLLRATDDRFLAEEAEPTVGVEFGSVTLDLGGRNEDDEAVSLLDPSSSTTPQPQSDIASKQSQSSSSKQPPSSSAQPPSRVKIQIWDTAGSEAFRGITRSYYRGAAGCLLVYDVTHRPSFTNAKAWLQDVRQHAEDDAVVVLVGNRVDLVEGAAGQAQRKVQVDEARKFAREQGILFIETSAKTGANVHLAFQGCVREIHRRFTASQAQQRQQSSSSSSHSQQSSQLLKSRTGARRAGGEAGSGTAAAAAASGDAPFRLRDGADAGTGSAREGACCVIA